jgi:8-oxo-dGTP diphosphatase
MGEERKPLVGIALIVLDKNLVLLGKRKGSHGAGTWSFPGGKLEYFELSQERALKELEEETGLRDINVKMIDKIPCAVTEDLFHEGLHYITLYLRAQYISGNPRVTEPNKCERWKWFPWDEMPIPLFQPVRNLIKQNYDPFRY